MKNKEYILSLNVSTNKVGWTCILPDNRILKYNNKLAFGVHEFREAQTAEERRNSRTNRRLKARRKKRLQLTQEVFEPILQVQYPDFLKLDSTYRWQNNSSFYHNLHSVLTDLGVNITEYPTMYHVRHDLMTTTEKRDLRLIFIAVYNLIKYRGHFHYKGQWGQNNAAELNNYWAELLASYEELTPLPLTLDSASYKELDQIISSDGNNKSKVAQVAKNLDKTLQPFISAILDMSVPLTKLFPVSENYGLYKENKLKIQLTDENFTEIYEFLTESEQICVELMIQVQQIYMLNDILGDYKTISEAKVQAYEVFANDLKILKEAMNAISPDLYRETFISTKQNIKAYQNEPSEQNFKRLSRLDRFLQLSKEHEPFYKFVQQVMTAADENVPNRAYILEQIEKNMFLKKLKGRFNVAIPVQNNVYELQLLLKNQQKHYEEITDDIIQKLVDIITFKIPFYVGPLSNGNSEYGWIVRKGDEAITPFNFEQQIDLKASNEMWIKSLIGDCSFVAGEKVLPDNSLLLQEYKVLNELNVVQFRVSNEAPNEAARIPQKVKLWLFENVFKQKKKVTHTAVYKALENSPYSDFLYDNFSGEMKTLYGTGKPNEFKNSLSSWITFSSILGKDMDVQMVEEIIYWLSMYSEERFVKEQIEEHYPHLNDSVVQKILNFNLSGWGNLSNMFLNAIPTNSKGQTIIEALRSQCVNLSMLKKAYQPYLDEYNKPFRPKVTKFTYSQVDDLTGSKAIKRGIWRTLKIVEEITALFGNPSKIVLNVEKEREKLKKRSKNRKEQWTQFGKSLSFDKEAKNFYERYANEPESAFRDDAFWLFITQLGRCAFTGKPIALDNAIVSHILPKSMLNDDSLSNKVLINKDISMNRKPKQTPLEMLYASERVIVQDYWETLHNYKLIDQLKYYRLLKETISEDDVLRSVEHQLVERRQIVKNVEVLLNQRFPNIEVYSVKSGLLTAFRKKLDLHRGSDVNSKHAAIDSLLAGLLVQFSITKYGSYLFRFDITNKDNYEKLKSLVAKYNQNFFLFNDFLEEGAFIHKKTNMPIDMKDWLVRVNDTYEWQLTKMREKDTESFYDKTIYSPKVKQATYNSPKTAIGVHSSLKKDAVYAVEFTEMRTGKEVSVKKLVDMTNIEAVQWKGISLEEQAYLLAEKAKSAKAIGISDAKILRCLFKGQKVVINEHLYLIVSSRELENATPLQLPNELIIANSKLYKAKEWDNAAAIELFNKIKEESLKQVGHILTPLNLEAIQSYNITDERSYTLGYSELLRAFSCSSTRSLTLNFGGRITKKYKYEDLYVVDESITGLKYKK